MVRRVNKIGKSILLGGEWGVEGKTWTCTTSRISHFLQSPVSLGFMLRFVNIFPLFRSGNYELKLLFVIYRNIKLMILNKKILLKKVIRSHKVFSCMDFRKNKNNLNPVKLLDKLVKYVFMLRRC